MLDIGREGVGISVAIYKNKGLIFFLAHARTSIRCPEAAVLRPSAQTCSILFVLVCIRGGIDAFRNPSENVREPGWEMAKSWKV